MLTMPHQRPQYYKNDLQLVDLDKKSLSDTLNKLRVAVLRGVDLIQAGDPPTKEWGSGGLFNGTPGMHYYANKTTLTEEKRRGPLLFLALLLLLSLFCFRSFSYFSPS